MRFKYDDGGRSAAGYKGHTGDCVTRAIAIATGKPYQEVYDAINMLAANERTGKRKRGKSSARTGVYKDTIRRYMASIGWRWIPTMQIGSGCKVHLTDGELPMGHLVVNVSKHCTAVIDGTVHDTHDPQREVAIFRQFPGWQTAELKPNEQRNQNGIFTIARRCVYGYYIQAEAPCPTK